MDAMHEIKTIDDRLKLLSYSSILTLHACPRKFQLYRLNSAEDEMNSDAEINQNLTFAYGHAIGEGIQLVLAGYTEQEVIFKLFCSWYVDLLDVNPKQNKSFWAAISAIQRFIFMKDHGFLEDYELVMYKDKPAVELSFQIHLPNGFKFRGSVDAVLRHKVTGEILVLECKTTSSTTLHQAMYKNSSQAIGYSVVLDVLFSNLSSYKVLYLVYQTKNMNYEQFPFMKSYLMRAQWIQELIHDVNIITMYEESGIYPMRGESCYSFGRSCEYFSTCTLSTKFLTKKIENNSGRNDKIINYDIELTLEELIAGQLEKNKIMEENNIVVIGKDNEEEIVVFSGDNIL